MGSQISKEDNHSTSNVESVSEERGNSPSKRRKTDELSRLREFCNLCREGVLETTEYSANCPTIQKISLKASVPDDKITDEIDAYVLPNGTSCWPSFLFPKQTSAFGVDVLCLRTDLPSVGRRKRVLHLLKTEGRTKNPIVIGTPGIGKSAELNYYLMVLIQNIHLPDWPHKVFFRDPHRPLFEISWSNDNLLVTKHAVNTLNELKVFTTSLFHNDLHSRDRCVLLLELDEDEIDPGIQIPTFISMSARDIKDVLKTDFKSGAVFFLADPPNLNELKLQAKAILLFSKLPNLFSNMTVNEVEALIETRANVIGCIPRYVLCDEESYERRFSEVSNGTLASFLKGLDQTGVDNLPNPVQLFVAPFNNRSSEDTNAFKVPSNFSFLFLSEYCKYRVMIQIQEDSAGFKEIKSIGLDFQIAETLMIDSLKESPCNSVDWQQVTSGYSRSDWQIYQDPGFRTELTANHRLSATVHAEYIREMSPKLPWTRSVVRFHGMLYHGDVKSLTANTFYRSKTHNFKFGEAFMVNHDLETVFFFQSTRVDLSNHGFQFQVIYDIMHNLQMFSTNYRLCIVCFIDWSQKTSHGTKFFLKSGAYTLGQLKAGDREIAAADVPDNFTSAEIQQVYLRVETVLIRFVYYPNNERYDLNPHT